MSNTIPPPQPPTLGRESRDESTTFAQLRALEALPLYRLPTELVLQVLQNLTFKDYPAFISATLPLLRRCRLIQNMSTRRLRWLLTRRRNGFVRTLPRLGNSGIQSHSFGPPVPDFSAMALTRRASGFHGLPNELQALVIQNLGTVDKINLVLAWHKFSDSDIERMTWERILPFY